MNNLKLPPITSKSNLKIELIVKKIIDYKTAGKATTLLEKQIDHLVYRLYDLTYNEVKVIDPDFLQSKKQYDSIDLT